MKSFNAFVLLICSLHAVSAQAVTFTEDQVVDLVASDLSYRVVTLSQTYFVYHWANFGDLSSYKEGTQSEKIEHFMEDRFAHIESTYHQYMEHYQEGSTNYGLVGGGIYAARDPLSSTTFGRWGNAALAVIRLDPGARLFDLRTINPIEPNTPYEKGNRIWIQPATLTALQSQGCDVPLQGTIEYHWLKKDRCSIILGKAFNKLNIIGNIHSWWGGSIQGCMSNPDAFVIYDSNYLKQENRVQIYSVARLQDPTFTKLPNTDPAMELWNLIQKHAKVNEQNYYMDGSPGEFSANLSLPSASSFKVDRSLDLASWEKDHLFHCDESTPEEVTRAPDFTQPPPLLVAGLPKTGAHHKKHFKLLFWRRAKN